MSRDLVALVTSPSICSFIHNPARSNVDDFKVVRTTSGREYVVPESTLKQGCFVLFGLVRDSRVTELSTMGSSDWLNKRIELYPLTTEFVLAYNFFHKVLGIGGIQAFRDFVSIGTYPVAKKSECPVRFSKTQLITTDIDADGGAYKGTGNAPGPRKTGPTIHNLRADEDGEDLLYEVLQSSIEAGGLDGNRTG